MSLKTLFRRLQLNYYKTIYFAPTAVEYQTQRRHERRSKSDNYNRYGKTTALLLSSVIVATVTEKEDEVKSTPTIKEKLNNDTEKIEAGEKRDGLPTYTAEEVSKHNNKSSFWVTYKHGVYDVTGFLTSHPGGEQIYNAAGLSIEPFWNVYGMHKTPEIYKLLESFRIGNLHDDDVADHSDDEMWAREPPRDQRLVVKTAKPFNAEIPAKLLVESFHTPNEVFYVRQHMPAPELDEAEHRLTVRARRAGGERSVELRLSELDRYPRATLQAALMCAGNRRSEMNEVAPVKGISWQAGAISNAVWSGVWLRDVLRDVLGDDLRGDHIIFTGADMDATGEQFSTSIPLTMAMDPGARVLLATHMNGLPLPRDHGYPLRVIVPGAPAVRSVKWLESITVGDEESPSHWHQHDYRGFNPSTTWESADFGRAPPVYSLPVTSAVCDPQPGDTVSVDQGTFTARGYAYSGGGASILRVDVSVDGGRSWLEAELQRADDPPRAHYAWTLWTAHLPAPPHLDEVEIWVKATDSNFNTQPERFHDIWNIRGILANAYHRVRVTLRHP